jgi:hypothetical protein
MSAPSPHDSAPDADPATIRRLLQQSRTIAVVGLSGDPDKPTAFSRLTRG